jgi:multiple sugar transport system substrate-binding protein
MTLFPSSRLALSSLIAVVLLFTGCGRTGEKSGGRVTITFWHSFVASTIPAVDELVKTFEADHPGITIKAQYVPTGDALVQKLVTAVQSNTAPDIAWIHSDFIDKLVQSGAITRMDDFIYGNDSLTGAEIADIFPSLLQSACWRDTLYALPMEATSLALVYNRGLLRAAGFDHPPATWDELRRYARALTTDQNRDGTPEQYGFYVPIFPASGDLSIWMTLQWYPFLWQAGGEEISADQSRVLFNSDAGIKALELWKGLYDDMNFSRFTIAHDIGFASRHLAMVMDGPWNLPRYRSMKDIDWAVAPLPAGPNGRATYVAGEHLAIFRQSAHPREAWTFVKWVLRPEIQASFSMKSGYLPVRRSTLSLKVYRDFLAGDPAMKAFVDQMTTGKSRRPLDYHRMEVNHFLAEAIEKATLGKMDPKTVLDDAAARSNALLRPEKR